MSDDSRAMQTLAASDYDAIEQAVMETARGRWFLREFAARNRNSDTGVLLDAIGRLEKAVSGERMAQQIDHVRFDLVEMAKMISRLKLELAAAADEGEQSQFDQATTALDEIVRTTERATSTILESAESIQEVAWSLREQQVDEEVCERIDRLATDIYTACAFQDLTAQRTQKVVRTLRALEGRINGLVDAWDGKEPQAAPSSRASAPTADLSQSDIDIVIVDNETAGLAPDLPPSALPDLPPAVSEALVFAESIADIDDGAPGFAGDGQPFAGLPAPELAPPPHEVIEVDDSDLVDIAFVVSADEPDQSPDMTVRQPPAETPRARSLAEIDAMPTTAKALIFG